LRFALLAAPELLAQLAIPRDALAGSMPQLSALPAVFAKAGCRLLLRAAGAARRDALVALFRTHIPWSTAAVMAVDVLTEAPDEDGYAVAAAGHSMLEVLRWPQLSAEERRAWQQLLQALCSPSYTDAVRSPYTRAAMHSPPCKTHTAHTRRAPQEQTRAGTVQAPLPARYTYRWYICTYGGSHREGCVPVCLCACRSDRACCTECCWRCRPPLRAACRYPHRRC
jgi:hypothetical protein